MGRRTECIDRWQCSVVAPFEDRFAVQFKRSRRPPPGAAFKRGPRDCDRSTTTTAQLFFPPRSGTRERCYCLPSFSLYLSLSIYLSNYLSIHLSLSCQNGLFFPDIKAVLLRVHVGMYVCHRQFGWYVLVEGGTARSSLASKNSEHTLNH